MTTIEDLIPESDKKAIRRAEHKHVLDGGWESLKTYCCTAAARNIINRIFHDKWSKHKSQQS